MFKVKVTFQLMKECFSFNQVKTPRVFTKMIKKILFKSLESFDCENIQNRYFFHCLLKNFSLSCLKKQPVYLKNDKKLALVNESVVQ